MHVLGVFAHPDDEAYGMAGCMSRYTAEGIGATIVSFTKGEAGEITEGSGATRETLGEVRERELRTACGIVGCTDVRIVGTADSGTTFTDDGVAYITDVIRELRPEVVITMEPEGITRHPDHKAVSLMTMRAVEAVAADNIVQRLFLTALPRGTFDILMSKAIDAGVQLFDPDDPLAPRPTDDETIACHVRVTDEDLKRKVQALWAHKSQSQGFIGAMPPELAEEFLSHEPFQRVVPPFEPGDPVTDDLFEGLR